MMKKLVAGLMAGIATVVMAGCGSDLSGTYVGEPFSDTATITYVLEVKKGNKDGYNMNLKEASYEATAKLGEGSVYYNPLFNSTGKKNINNYEITANFNYEIINQLFASAVDKNNTMTYRDSKNAGLLTGTIEVDKDGNLIDVSGAFSNMQGRRFVKVKELNMDELKKKLQESTTKFWHSHYDHSNTFSDSQVTKITFNDEKQ